MAPIIPGEDTVRSSLSRYFGANILADVRVGTKIKDYLRYQRDREYHPCEWGDVIQACIAVQAERLGLSRTVGDGCGDNENKQHNLKEDGRGDRLKPVNHLFDYLTDADKERMKAICQVCAEDATYRVDVQRFRQEYLKGRLLSPDEYLKVIESPGLGLFSPNELSSHGIDLTAVSETLSCEDNNGCVSYKVAFPDKGTVLETTKHFWKDLAVENTIFSVQTFTDSVLYRLQQAGKVLAKRYVWTERESCRFLLTGEPPWNPQLSMKSTYIYVAQDGPAVSFGDYGEWKPERRLTSIITLQLPDWLAPKQVANIYRYRSAMEQGRFTMPNYQPKRLAGRPPEKKGFLIYQFVEQEQKRTGLGGQHRDWPREQRRQIFGNWNEQCAEGLKVDTLGHFYRAYDNALKLIAKPRQI